MDSMNSQYDEQLCYQNFDLIQKSKYEFNFLFKKSSKIEISKSWFFINFSLQSVFKSVSQVFKVNQFDEGAEQN